MITMTPITITRRLPTVTITERFSKKLKVVALGSTLVVGVLVVTGVESVVIVVVVVVVVVVSLVVIGTIVT